MWSCLVGPNELRPTMFWVPSHRFNSATGEQKGIAQTIYSDSEPPSRVPNSLMPSAKLRSANLPFFKSLVWRGRGSNPGHPHPERTLKLLCYAGTVCCVVGCSGLCLGACLGGFYLIDRMATPPRWSFVQHPEHALMAQRKTPNAWCICVGSAARATRLTQQISSEPTKLPIATPEQGLSTQWDETAAFQ